MAGTTLEKKSLDKPDETRALLDKKGKLQLVGVGDYKIGRGIFEPGWKWSKHVKPIVKTDFCEAAHTGYVVQGRMRIKMKDGVQSLVGPGDAFFIPPGHDAWVVGDKRCVVLDITGAADYAKPQQ